ncbi:GAP family protein [Planosporangium mesophilum]|uniref:GAP family protein n=1 Tax=Planosporangium mesophilum TaxID=689768 RepID=UPI001EF31A7C|nr:GAP family protein [Planosporangium mesophilum]
MSLLTLLPMAVVMVAGPQLVSALLLATGKNPKPASSAFLSGVALAVVIGLSVAYWLARLVIDSASGGGGGARRVVDWVVLALLAILAVLVYGRRTRTDPPRWMGTLQTASPGFAFGLGFLLFLLMPTDIATMFTVAGTLAAQARPLWHSAPFILLTLLLVALPLLMLLLLGDRALAVQSRIRDWTNTHSWIVSEAVILYFAAMTVSSIVTG